MIGLFRGVVYPNLGVLSTFYSLILFPRLTFFCGTQVLKNIFFFCTMDVNGNWSCQVPKKDKNNWSTFCSGPYDYIASPLKS